MVSTHLINNSPFRDSCLQWKFLFKLRWQLRQFLFFLNLAHYRHFYSRPRPRSKLMFQFSHCVSHFIASQRFFTKPQLSTVFITSRSSCRKGATHGNKNSRILYSVDDCKRLSQLRFVLDSIREPCHKYDSRSIRCRFERSTKNEHVHSFPFSNGVVANHDVGLVGGACDIT